jgi:hypothetical protein
MCPAEKSTIFAWASTKFCIVRALAGDSTMIRVVPFPARAQSLPTAESGALDSDDGHFLASRSALGRLTPFPRQNIMNTISAAAKLPMNDVFCSPTCGCFGPLVTTSAAVRKIATFSHQNVQVGKRVCEITHLAC